MTKKQKSSKDESNVPNNNKDKNSYYIKHIVTTSSRGKEKPLEYDLLAKSIYIPSSGARLNYPKIQSELVTYDGVTNSQNATIEAFRLLSRHKSLFPDKPLEFDQSLCMLLVMRHRLSCVDCKLECEMHEWEANK